MRIWLIGLATLGTILLYLLAIASGSTSRLAQWYWEIFALNSALLLSLLALIGQQLWRLRQEIRHRIFGAKLTLRLVSMFALVAVLPGILLFTVSVQFLNRSIESWFNVRVETALDRGLNLGRSALDTLLTDLTDKGLYAVRTLSAAPANTASMMQAISHLREQLNVQEIALFDHDGRLLVFAGDAHASQHPPIPNSDVHLSVQQTGLYRAIEPLPHNRLELRVVLPLQLLSWPMREHYLLQIIQPAPTQLADDAQLVESTRAEYQQLALLRAGLKQFYRLTLGLTLMLSLAGAVTLGMFLSRRLSAPLSDLAAGTRAIAQGDFSHKNRVHNRDELGMLGAMFNRMTRQLADARTAADHSRAEIEAHKLYLESILGNLSSGVLAFDGQTLLNAANPSAEQILGVDIVDLSRYPLNDWLEHAPQLAPLVNVLQHHAHRISPHALPWQEEIHYQTPQGERLLLARGTELPDNAGVVMVFDDITELAHAQRDAAWGEVAKRLAHEIRNPLTPIQLAAERLQMKLAEKLPPTEADMLQRSTDTIVKQVAALKRMVEAFRDYARAPGVQLRSLDANSVLREVLTLYEGHHAVHVELTSEKLPILGDTALLRQVIHNLLANAQDAVLDVPNPLIKISSNKKNNACVIEFCDNGTGFAPEILPQAFEPYVTNKKKGTGLGLAVVKKIIEEHRGGIQLSHSEHGGARIVITLPLMETSCEVAIS